jgi:hypothetical protein
LNNPPGSAILVQLFLNYPVPEDAMPRETSYQQIAHTFLTGLKDRDWDAMRTVMADDIVWSLPGSSRISGQAVGVDAVLQRAQTIVGYGLDFALKHVLYGVDGVTLSLNNTAKRGALVLDEHLATVCTIRHGKIVRIDTYLSDVDMANAFFV